MFASLLDGFEDDYEFDAEMDESWDRDEEDEEDDACWDCGDDLCYGECSEDW